MHKKLSNNKCKEGVQVFTLFLSEGSQTLQTSSSPPSVDQPALKVKKDCEGQPLQNQKNTLLHQYLRHKRIKTSLMVSNTGGEFLLPYSCQIKYRMTS